ncbi:MAG: ATP-grasp domain-containing protein, partial [Planctomycetaceae bacterium]|nr:ATP-grasp domain-containing protein [Planctomycetaceae bacterium]
SVRSAAQLAVVSGLRPVCVDLFGDADLRLLLSGLSWAIGCQPYRQIKRFADVVTAISDIDPDVPVVFSGGLENDAALLERLQADRHVAGMSAETIRRLRDPEDYFSVLRREGVAVPNWMTDFSSACRQLRDRSAAPDTWLLKSRTSSGGIGIRRWNGLPVTLPKSQEDERRNFLQRFVGGTAMSATYFADRQSSSQRSVRLVGTCVQVIGEQLLFADGFQFCGNVGPMEVPESIRGQLEHIGLVTGRNFDVCGFFGIDFVLNADRVVVIEINPRITASLELFEVPQQTRHLAMQLTAFVRSSDPAEPKSPAEQSFVEPTDMIADDHRSRFSARPKVRLVLYAADDLHVTANLSARMLYHCRLTVPARPGDALQRLLSAELCPDRSGERRTEQFADAALVRPNQGTVVAAAQPFFGTGEGCCVWLADIPSAESVVPKGTPLCSIYAESAGSSRLIRDLNNVLSCLPQRFVPRPDRLAEIMVAAGFL